MHDVENSIRKVWRGRPLRIRSHRWECNIIMDLREIKMVCERSPSWSSPLATTRLPFTTIVEVRVKPVFPFCYLLHSAHPPHNQYVLFNEMFILQQHTHSVVLMDSPQCANLVSYRAI